MFSTKTTIALVLLLAHSAKAQAPKDQIYPAGGKWNYSVSEDKLTGAQYGMFELLADEKLADGISAGYPSLVIMCGGTAAKPQWVNSKFISPVVLGRSDTQSVLSKAPQQTVLLRADNAFHAHFWNIAEDFHVMFVDKGATKEVLNTKTSARIQFRDSSEHKQVAIFSPAEINQKMLTAACGMVFK
jgi:hypothetical protein